MATQRCRCRRGFTCDTCGAPINNRGARFPKDGQPTGAWAHSPGTRPTDGHRATPVALPWMVRVAEEEENS